MTQNAVTLSQQLADTKAVSRQQIPAEGQAIMARATADLEASGLIEQTLKVGDPMPDFELPNATGTPVRLSQALANGPVVIAFYRGLWCPYCNLELKALQQILPDIKAAGASLIAISPQTPDASLSTVEKNELEFDVLSDVGNVVARQLGLVFTLPVELRPLYEGFGIDLPAHNGDRTFELPVPATYVVAPDGRIAYAFAEADYTLRAEPAEVLEALNSLAINV